MAVNFIFWNGNQATDIHLVVGATSRTLNDLLVINHETPGKNDFALPPLPHDVTVNFTANFVGILAADKFKGFGVTLDVKTGAVSVAAHVPGTPFLRNFIVRAVVKDASVAPATVFTREIRFHVHQAVTSAWLTPDTLDLRRDADGLRFSIFAEFDDKVVGDISNIAGTVWKSAPGAAVSVIPGTGALTVITDNVPSTLITAQLPPLYGAKVCTGTVRTLVPWSTPVMAKLIPGGAGAARINEVVNFLFLPDGFTHGEQNAFEQRALSFVTFLRTSPASRPFDLCNSEINFWTAWVESPARGTSPLYEIAPEPRATGFFGTEVPPATVPPPAAAAWDISQLIHEVGLPVAAHAGLGFGAQVLEWSLVYGVGTAFHVTAAVHAAWVKLANRSLVNEQNTAFGIALGERPRAEEHDPPRSMTFHPFRTTRAQLDPFFANIHDAAAPPANPPIGGVWGPGGKDRSFVAVLCAGSRYGGGRTHPPSELIAVGLTQPLDVEIAPVVPTGGFDLVPYPIPASSPLDLMCRVAHESAHALGLGDEYGYAGTLTPGRLPDLAAFLNLQDVASASLPAPQPGLDPALLKWNWPRITKAGVLAAVPSPAGADYTLTLQAGHGAKFATGDIVRLRTRPLTPGIVPSIELSVTGKGVDTLTVHPSIPGFVPIIFVAGSIVYVQRETTPVPPAQRGNPLGLVSPTVLGYMATSKIPLNIAPIAPGAHVCSPDASNVQRANNKPGALPAGRPKWSAWIVGAFEGGLDFGCGVLHPTGACMMRQLVLEPAAAKAAFGVADVAYRFCPVCRYILVDRIDPSQHGLIDADYQPHYAEP